MKSLSTVQFSDTLAVINLRSALSFKKVDYLVLGTEPGHEIYFVTSDPSALMLEEAASPVDSDLTGLDRVNIHPALLSLSTDAVDGETPHGMPEVVLPVGRLFYGVSHGLLYDIMETMWKDTRLDDEVLRTDSRGRGPLLTPIKYFETLLSDVPELLEYLELPPEDKAVLIEYLREWLFVWTQDRGKNPNFHRKPPIERELDIKLEYTDKIFNMLKGNAQIPKISREMLEKKRRELWHAVMQISSTFKDTGYVAVIDAITPGHPVWLVQSPQREETAGVYEALSTPHVAQLLPKAKEWLNSYGTLNTAKVSQIISSSRGYLVKVGTVGQIIRRDSLN